MGGKKIDGLSISFLILNAEQVTKIDTTFNFIMAIQSFEHMQDDLKALKGMNTLLNEKGYIMLTLPSHPSLFIYGIHGHRRYGMSRIKEMASEANLSIIEFIRIGGIMNFILHFILWTVPAILFQIPIWKLYNRFTILKKSIIWLEKLSLKMDKTFRFLEGGYVVILSKE
ncbi:methyltransferase domain-containing protein [Chloroflexota bacterium]